MGCKKVRSSTGISDVSGVERPGELAESKLRFDLGMVCWYAKGKEFIKKTRKQENKENKSFQRSAGFRHQALSQKLSLD